MMQDTYSVARVFITRHSLLVTEYGLRNTHYCLHPSSREHSAWHISTVVATYAI